MKSYFDVQQLLKRYGTVIYTGDRALDLELMEEEVNELNRMGMIDKQVFLQARIVLREEKRKAGS
ncbi:hypothetical protein CR205_08585 [Alteribacter lacisalsi]|uniref:DUF910 family protein n=1 Tax=Alteribacter lacisalsi TaxID=2045244 RepID=A0A2W0HCN2_9BACI|nr:YqgQ family protein [Alteribacter lacisalsi]PYZ98621.1 hypothetical protein CR205_08585 [Alteribacter lacisalsi]